MANKNELAKSTLVEEVALAKINQYMDLGMVLPDGFNPANSLKKARLMLNDMKVGGKPVLEVVSQASIIQCLIDACCKGLDFSENQIYFIPRQNTMTTMESVYGRIARAKRASKNYKPIVQYVHEDDVFEIGVNVENGQTVIKKHETSLENLDKPIIAAYTYVTDDKGDTEVYIMTKREWLTSWKKSSNGCAVAKEFERDMIFRSIIKKSTKSLVNANVKAVGITFNDDDDTMLAGDKQPEFTQQVIDAEAEEIKTEEGEVVDVQTGEVIQPSEEKKNEPEF
jgi:recombinational DNA repair protein RecT